MHVIKPPNPVKLIRDEPAFFLAGSIEQGKARNWQANVEKHLHQYFPGEYGIILNPRRDDWDSTLEQTSSNPKFREQVEWELQALERCDLVGMYFAESTMSPITLLEFGLFARSGKLIVCCEEQYWRKGNVDIVCERYGIERVWSEHDLASKLSLSWKVRNSANRVSKA